MKISEVSLSVIKAHCGVSDNDSDELLEIYRASAVKQICDYTGLSADELDEYEDLVYAVLVIVGDMFGSRTMTVEQDKLNPMAVQIMNLHCRNLIV